jgi:hypothetical protein
MTQLAIVFGAGGVMPLLALSVWPRARGFDAAAGLLAGLATVEAFILVNGGVATFDATGRAAVYACAAGVITGIVASFLHRADPSSAGDAFARGLLRGRADLLNPDKGA